MQSLRDRHDLKEHCGSCDYKNVCGGCRARAYAYFDDIKAPDIGCIYNLPAYNALKDKLRASRVEVETTETAESSLNDLADWWTLLIFGVRVNCRAENGR